MKTWPVRRIGSGRYSIGHLFISKVAANYWSLWYQEEGATGFRWQNHTISNHPTKREAVEAARDELGGETALS